VSLLWLISPPDQDEFQSDVPRIADTSFIRVRLTERGGGGRGKKERRRRVHVSRLEDLAGAMKLPLRRHYVWTNGRES
jgi:hypothetical protein